MKPIIIVPGLRPLLLAAAFPATLFAQSPITSFTASYKSTPASGSLLSYLALPALLPGAFSGCSLSLFTYNYNSGSANQYQLNSFNVGGKTYLVAPASTASVQLRRVNNSNVSGKRNILYMETTTSTANACPLLPILDFKPPYIDVMEDLLSAGMLNQGTDNLFTNAGNGDGNNNNIERVDVIFSGGLNTASPSEAGFAIFDRGNNYQHDGFRIAAITGLDASGNPSSFGAVKICTPGNGSNSNGSWGHPSSANGNRQLATYVLRKDVADPYLRVSSNVNQEIGGVFYTFSNLGIAADQPLYGYALLGPDGTANPSSAQLLNLGNTSVYPTTTTESSGGLDLVAVNTVFATGSYVVLPLTVTGFTGRSLTGQTDLQWQLQYVKGNEQILVQRSSDGLQFMTIGQIDDNGQTANGNGSYTDKNPPATASTWYRLAIAYPSGQTIYSQVLTLHTTISGTALRIYPTVIAPTQPLTLEGLADGYYTVSFTDAAGRRNTSQVKVINKNALVSWPPANSIPGLYWLTLTARDGSFSGSSAVLVR